MVLRWYTFRLAEHYFWYTFSLAYADQVVVGEKDKEELPELKDESNQFKEFLNK
jgi:hypothetical protein